MVRGAEAFCLHLDFPKNICRLAEMKDRGVHLMTQRGSGLASTLQKREPECTVSMPSSDLEETAEAVSVSSLTPSHSKCTLSLGMGL